MPNPGQVFTGWVAWLLCAALLPASATTSWAADPTHLAVHPRHSVTLEMKSGVRDGCGDAKLDFVRLRPDGSSDSAVFRIPEGYMLMVTDFDWHYFNGTPGQVVILSLIIENLADASRRHRAAESPVRLGPDGVGASSEHMTSGFTVSPEARLCVDVVNGSLGSPLRLSKVLIRGYLAKE